MKIPTRLTRLRDEIAAVEVLRRAGIVPTDPRALVAGGRAIVQLGPLGGLPAFCAAGHGDRVAIIDDRGEVTFAEFARRTHQLAYALRAQLSPSRPGVGILCRNHSESVIALFAANAIGARVVLLNSDFSRQQVADVAARERLECLLYDEEFGAAAEGFAGKRWCTWWADVEPLHSTKRLRAAYPSTLPPRPAQRAALVILTSGSTGTPKGAPRDNMNTALLPAGLLRKIPLRPNDRILLSAPIFHGWGLSIATLALVLGATLVLHRRFDPARAVRDLEAHECTVFIAVPTMLRRVLALEEEVARADLRALRIVASGGARLDPSVVSGVTDAFGQVLHNLYGSTEAAYITIATPEDLAVSPDSAGRPTPGTTVRILDGDDKPVAVGATGRILVRTPTQIDKYTDGTAKSRADGFLDTGDVGHLDAAGALHVTGRSDGMIVSGGENVFPEEVEQALLAHPHIADAAVTPVNDPDFGQRLRAYIVPADDSLAVDDVREYLGARLSRSRMPRDVIFVPDLPRGSSGKVLRRTLDALQEAQP
ncbi:AMP-binding protein [Smaragdicoccus niigatensis]|uniref:AMP-binding protein n=1 Tax=Smaragdicoccus niigatensis TaxID=359359 RepID=UPI000378D16C|nr:AMP-binding protein [Smaragdicoccus niigatensis]